MQFSSSLFPQPLTNALLIVCCLLLLAAVRLAPWRLILAVPVRQHALFATLVVLGLIWSFRFEVVPGLHFHPFLMMASTLIFGWSLTLLVGALAAILVTLLGNADAWALPWDWMMSVVVPATLNFALMRLLYRLRLRNLFFYILGLGFFGTIVTTLVTCVLGFVLLWLTQDDRFLTQLWDRDTVVIPLLYAEGFLNGVLVTAITVFIPELVKTFDEHYFR